MHLKTLGTVDLESPAGRVDALLRQPRRFALLVFLSLEGRKARVRRDTLLATFWPERDPIRAGRSLSQALHFLRDVLGSRALSEPRQSDIRVDPDECSCDAVQFLDAVESGQYDRALDLYAGEFLPGFHAGGTLEFQQWLDGQRNQLKRVASEAALELAGRAASERDALKAAVLVRRSAELLALDEPMLQRQMRILTEIGDGTGALQLYDAFQRLLKQEFSSTPSRETAAFAATIGNAGGASDSHDAPKSAEPDQAIPHRRRLRIPWVSVGSMIAIAAFAALWGLGRRRPEALAAGSSHVQIALADFIDYQTDKPHLSSAIAAELSGRIAQLEGWVVTQGNRGSADALPESDYKLTGGVMRVDTGARVTAVLSNRYTGATISHKVIFVRASDLGTLVEQSAAAVSDFVRTAVGKDRRLRAVRALRPRRAASLVELGMAAKERGDSLRELRSSDAAEAAFHLADSLFAQAEQVSRNSSLPTLLRAETALRLMWVYVAPPLGDTRRAADMVMRGLVMAQRVIEHDPSDLDALELRGVLQHWLWQLSPASDVDQIHDYRAGAEADFKRVLRDDPHRARVWSLLSAALMSRGEFAAARVAAERAYATDAYLAEWRDILVRLFFTSLETGDTAAGTKWCAEINRRTGVSFPSSYCKLMLLAQAGQSTDADLRKALLIADAPGADYMKIPQLKANVLLMTAVVAAHAADARATRSLADSARRADPDDPELLPLYAMICQAVGDEAASGAYLRDYVQADPARNAGVMRSLRFSERVRTAALQEAPVRGADGGSRCDDFGITMKSPTTPG